MKYCSSCGNQIDGNTSFCPHCGSRQSATAPAPDTYSSAPRGRRLHCPQCRSSQLSPIVETDVQGGNAVHTPINRRISYSTVQMYNTHRDYWMCQHCGHKFRNIDNLKAEIATETKRMKGILVCLGLFSLVLLLTLTSDLWLWGIILILPILLFVAAFYMSTKRKVQKMTEEKKFLSVHCFD